MESHLARIPTSTPVLYSTVTYPFQGYVCTQNTPTPTPKHSFSWPELESGQNELQSGQPGPWELTRFPPQIDQIFSTGTSKLYLKGWGLGFRAEILGVG